MLLKLFREGLGRIFILVSNLTLPKQIQRGPASQSEALAMCKSLSLYQFYACPFCLKVRRHIYRLNLNIQYKDAQNDPQHRQDLDQQGGNIQVPCLRIQHKDKDTWLYESDAIIAYLDKKFANL